MKLLKEKGTILTPTLVVFERYGRQTALEEHIAAIKRKRNFAPRAEDVLWYGDPAGPSEIATCRRNNLKVGRVQNKEAILYRLAEAALAHPDETVREALYPIVGEQTLRDLVAEERADRATFRAKLKTIDCHWLAQEAPGVHPGLSADRSLRSYLVTLDEQPMAYSAPHGGWLRWLT